MGDDEKKSLFDEIVTKFREIRLTHGGRQLEDSTLEESQVQDGATLHEHGRLAGGADVEDLSQKHKALLWLEMTTPDGEPAEYSMSEKNVKRSGTIHYECSMRKAKDRVPCTAKAVHYYDQAEPTITQAQHNHRPPNRAAKSAINRAKDEAVRYRDHRVSAIVDRAHGELEGEIFSRECDIMSILYIERYALKKMTKQHSQQIGALPRISDTHGRKNHPRQSTRLRCTD